MEYVKAKRIDPQKLGGEIKIQQIIAEDTSVLGLGDELMLIEREKRVFSNGKLDLLLAEPGNKTRYAVEIQLGATDESHIIRTIEYWDLLERTNPSFDHVAVIVAEQLTGRFFNVIRLFNQRIPLIAIQMTCIEIDGKATISFTKVLDRSPEMFGLESGSSSTSKENEAALRNYAGPKIMKIVEDIFAIAKEFSDQLRLNFTQQYVSINRGESRSLALSAILWPQKSQIRIGIYKDSRISTAVEKILETNSIDVTRDSSWGAISFAIRPEDFEKRKVIIRELMKCLYDQVYAE
ncbi:MAG: hypothetical protein WB424_01965 [Terracidiphilus sp.]